MSVLNGARCAGDQAIARFIGIVTASVVADALRKYVQYFSLVLYPTTESELCTAELVYVKSAARFAL